MQRLRPTTQALNCINSGIFRAGLQIMQVIPQPEYLEELRAPTSRWFGYHAPLPLTAEF